MHVGGRHLRMGRTKHPARLVVRISVVLERSSAVLMLDNRHGIGGDDAKTKLLLATHEEKGPEHGRCSSDGAAPARCDGVVHQHGQLQRGDGSYSTNSSSPKVSRTVRTQDFTLAVNVNFVRGDGRESLVSE